MKFISIQMQLYNSSPCVRGRKPSCLQQGWEGHRSNRRANREYKQ